MARTRKWGECGSDETLLWWAFLPSVQGWKHFSYLFLFLIFTFNFTKIIIFVSYFLEWVLNYFKSSRSFSSKMCCTLFSWRLKIRIFFSGKFWIMSLTVWIYKPRIFFQFPFPSVFHLFNYFKTCQTLLKMWKFVSDVC